MLDHRHFDHSRSEFALRHPPRLCASAGVIFLPPTDPTRQPEPLGELQAPGVHAPGGAQSAQPSLCRFRFEQGFTGVIGSVQSYSQVTLVEPNVAYPASSAGPKTDQLLRYFSMSFL